MTTPPARIDAARISAARARLTDLPPTPVLEVDDHLWLKLESLQPTGSFKVRGFLNAVRAADPDDLRAGIVTASAGNAALAAAWVARRLGIGCTVVMFDTAPAPKREGVERLGATVLAWPRVQVLEWLTEGGHAAMPEHFIHPFADEEVMAGHGTIGLEVLEQVPGVRRVIVPVGGGGLITGIATALGDGVEVVGAQSSGYPLWPRTMAEGSPPTLVPQTVADGTQAPYDAGMHALLRSAVGRWATVPEDDVVSAIGVLALRHKVVVEGAGALAYAAARMESEPVPTVAVVSGGNVAAEVLARACVP